jgi:hypothetical protein
MFINNRNTFLWGHYATNRKVACSTRCEVNFFNLPNPSSCIMAIGWTQPLTEMSTRNFPGGIGRTERKADKISAIR